LTDSATTGRLDLATAGRDEAALLLARVALAAGPVVMAEYAHGGPARAKGDGSPVTAADERAEATIRERLAAVARFYGNLIGVRYGEPFVVKETIRVDDVVALGVRSL